MRDDLHTCKYDKTLVSMTKHKSDKIISMVSHRFSGDQIVPNVFYKYKYFLSL